MNEKTNPKKPNAFVVLLRKFATQIAQLPAPVKGRFGKQMVAAFAICLMTIIFIAHFKSWEYSLGFLIALYVAYIGFDVVWKYSEGRVVCKRMKCVKAMTLPKVERLIVMMKELVSDESAEPPSVREYYIPISNKQKRLFTEGAICDIYYNESSPGEILAWEVVDYEQ